jgi:3-oxoacyl-[acyl-carrier-protein] synthase III
LQLTNTRTFGMSTNNCASTISALQTIDRVLAASGDPETRAVLVTADIAFTPVLQQIPNTSVTGDAAVACLLSRESAGHAVLASRVDIYGQHARCQWEREPEHAEFEAEYPRRLASTMSLALQQAGIRWQDVRWIIPHNVNVFSWKRVAKCAGIPMDRIYLAQVAKIAHCFGGDIFLNWYLAEQEGRFRAGDYLLLATVGLGAVFGAAVVQYAG